MLPPIRVLVVDDSPFMCRAITRMVSEQPGLEVAGTARNGVEALERIAELHPDVVTLDVEMPVMDGLTALERILAGPRTPVVMLSARTQVGSETTLRALELGAFDFVAKPESAKVDIFLVARELAAKIRGAAASSGIRRQPRLDPLPASRGGSPVLPAKPAANPAANAASAGIVLVGISTGGPSALGEFLPRLPAGYDIPVVVAQHMPAGFTRPLADRLDRLCPLRVREAVRGDRPAAGDILVAPAGFHLVFRAAVTGPEVDLLDSSDAQTWYKPSVDLLFASAAKVWGARALGLIMTGMGDDGTAGARVLKAAGGQIWAQDEATSAVYGMPRAVAEAGLVDRVLALPAIGEALAGLAPIRP